jgi:hypothetical protein
MNNIILGSGIVGLLAKTLLPTWKVIPFARSRFFSFNPAIDDNFIIRSESIDDPIADICGGKPKVYPYRRSFDVSGHLYGKYDKGICNDWLIKVFGSKVPQQIEPYFNKQMDLQIYDLRINQLYADLMERHLPELKAENEKGKITEIGDHYIVRNGVREEFDNAVSTIPLTALNKLVGITQDLPSKTVHLLHVQTEALDFEGYNQTLVVDPMFSFYKVTNVAPTRYLFFCHEEISQPGPYLMMLLKNQAFDILDGTSVSDYLTLGPIPKLDHLEQKGLYNVGSYAQWDWCMDVGSCVLRLVRYAQRGFKPFRRELVK